MGYKVKNEAKYAQGNGSLKNRIKYMEKTRPWYSVRPEALDNKEIAKREAFGTPQEIIAARTAIEQGKSDSMAEAAKVSDSGGGQLAMLEAINANAQRSYINLAPTEAAIMTQRLGDLYRNNYAYINETDKAFEYNRAAPYADQLTTLRDQKTQRVENWMRGADTIGAIAATASKGLTGGI